MKNLYGEADGKKNKSRTEKAVVDRALIARVLERDPAAERMLYDIAYNMVKPSVLARVPDRHAAKDVMQDAIWMVFEKLDTLQDVEKFPYWVKRIAINKAMDWQRRRKEILFSALEKNEEGETEAIRIADENPNHRPDMAIENSETARERRMVVGELLRVLKQEQQEVVRMRYMDNLKFQEIAERLGCSESTVKSKHRRAIAKMMEKARELQEEGSVPLLCAA